MNTHPLAAERLARGWSQQETAEMLGVSLRTIVRWERGQTLPYPYYREQLCILFGKDARTLGLLSPEVTVADRTPKAAVSRSIERKQSPSVSSTIMLDPLVPLSLSKTHTLLGREDLLTQLKTHLFHKMDARVTALYGLPGVGKTSIAIALASDPEVHRHFSDGILWVSLGPQPNIPAALTHWGSLLGLSPKDIERASDASSWMRALRTVIAQRRFLLVIDDAWSIEDALAFQIGGPSSVHLLTTRLPLVAEAFASRSTFPIPTLTYDDGVALLARYVPTIVEQEQQVQKLVQAVGGLPLALTLMGKHLALQAFSGQPNRLRRALTSLYDAQQRLEISTPLMPSEHPTSLEQGRFSLEAAIAINDQLLSESAHHALLALSVFPARPQTFSEEAAIAVIANSEQYLDELWDAGLLESDLENRYTLHQTISDYARVRREGTDALERLVRYVAQFVRKYEHNYTLLEAELSIIQVALDGAIRLEMETELVQSVLALTDFWYIRGLYVQGNHYVQQAWQRLETGAQVEWKVALLRDLARFTEVLKSNQEAEAYAQDGLALAREAGLIQLQGALLSRLEELARNAGQMEEAEQYCQEGLALANQPDYALLKTNFLYGLASVRINQRNYAEADKLLHEALEIAQQEQQQEMIAHLYRTLTKLSVQQSHFVQMIQDARAGLQVARAIGHRSLQCTLLNTIGTSLSYQGDHAQAITTYEEALALARQIGHRAQIAIALANLAAALVEHTNDRERAIVYFRETMELAREFGIQELVTQDALPLYLVHPEHLLGYISDASIIAQLLQQGVFLARRQNRHWDEATTLLYVGEFSLFSKQFIAAREAFEQTLGLNEGLQADPQLVGRAQYGLARLAALQGKYREARQWGEQSVTTLAQVGHYLSGQVRTWLEALPAIED